jgi:uncharacterized phage protein gp47/JayE
MAGPTIDGAGFHDFGQNAWIDWLETNLRAIYGDAIDLEPESPDGQLVGILSEPFVDFEQILKVVYNVISPAGAVGVALSRLVQLNGIARKAAQFSIAPVTLAGTPGTVIGTGALIKSNTDPTIPAFATTAPLTIGGGGTVSGQAQCTVAGPVRVISGDLTKIQTIIFGWDTVTNTADATPGRLVENDPTLRVRRAKSVAIPSQSMVDGLYAALANLAGVDDVVVYENPYGITDARRLPPHSINAIIDGGLNADIANAMWTKASMGVTKVGGITYTVLDAQANPQTMAWDTPSDVDVYITVVLTRAPNSYEESSIKNALVNYGIDTSRIGQSVPVFDLASPINDLNITGGPGLPSITAIHLGDAPSPTLEADLIVAYNARPRFHVSRVSVVGP